MTPQKKTGQKPISKEDKKEDGNKPVKKPKEQKITKTSEISNKTNSVEKDLEFSSEEYRELSIPALPEAPKKKKKITIDSPGLSTNLLKIIKELESPSVRVVLVNCDRCKEVIPIPVPKDFVLKSELPVVPVSYVHMNNEDDQHCLTIHLDHDFDIRRQRLSDVILSKQVLHE